MDTEKIKNNGLPSYTFLILRIYYKHIVKENDTN